jgi:hypothetical protein
MRRTLVAAILLSSMLWIAVLADVELVYTSGDTIQGSDVERDGDYYVLTKHDGSTVQIPLSDITEVRLGVGEDTAIDEQNLDPDQDQPRTGLQVAEPTQLAGQPVEPTTPSQALAVFGKPAQFQAGPQIDQIEPTYWDISQDALADSRSTWAQAPTDPEWHPTSALGADQLAGHESTWAQAPTDSTWVPQNGFRN